MYNFNNNFEKKYANLTIGNNPSYWC